MKCVGHTQAHTTCTHTHAHPHMHIHIHMHTHERQDRQPHISRFTCCIPGACGKKRVHGRFGPCCRSCVHSLARTSSERDLHTLRALKAGTSCTGKCTGSTERCAQSAIRSFVVLCTCDVYPVQGRAVQVRDRAKVVDSPFSCTSTKSWPAMSTSRAHSSA